jgi:hypothetical protein
MMIEGAQGYAAMAVTGGAAGWRGIHVQELGRRSTISSRASLACRLPLVFIQKTKEEDEREHRRDQKAMDAHGGWCDRESDKVKREGFVCFCHN